MGIGVDSLDFLEKLVAFPTVSLQSNREMIGFIRGVLEKAGARVSEFEGPRAGNRNLFATIGPEGRGGVVLSGHTDVVPTEGQAWTVEPFRLSRHGDRLYGRGTADMKGFLACALRAATLAGERWLETPLHLAFSCDEEIGCVGVRPMLDALALEAPRPIACIVGEPTSMRLTTGHKGKIAMQAICRGRAGHSAYAPDLLNPITIASALIAAIGRLQARTARHGPRDEAYEVPYATLHVGRIMSGEALNVVPSQCLLELEIRSATPAEAERLLRAVRATAARIAKSQRARFPEADIEIQVTNAYPALDAPADDAAVALVRRLTGDNGAMKAPFGTEAGLFREQLGAPTVICGPGSMEQGHKADEYVTVHQLELCDRMMDALLGHLSGH
jgi:acetylornithine deacetylase